jgi:hypothetical protein
MYQRIQAFHQDSEGHWVADLECGHGQHMRHDPPMTDRPWVLTAQGRAERVGQSLQCKRCDEAGLEVARRTVEACRETLKAEYEEAGIRGLCEEGRFEVAVGALDHLDLKQIIESPLK